MCNLTYIALMIWYRSMEKVTDVDQAPTYQGTAFGVDIVAFMCIVERDL